MKCYSSSNYCPRQFNSCVELEVHSLTLSQTVSYFSLVSCSLSVLGSLLIVFSYWRWKDIRTGSRSVVTFLAVADFFTAAGYIVGSVNYILHFNNPDDTYECVNFQQVCKLQSYVTTWSSMSSFAWTSFLAVYLYLTIVHGRIILANRLIPLVHVIAWVCPFLITYPLLVDGRLGQSRIAASTWCFIEDHNYQEGKFSSDTIVVTFLAGKLWEVLTYVVVCILYLVIKCHLRKERKSGEQFLSDGVLTAVVAVDRKMTFIPIVFILLRIWGTAQFFFITIESWAGNVQCGCITTESGYRGLTVLGYLQAIGDGGQGWGNAILYIFLSAKLRGRLFGWLYRPLINCCLVAVGRYKHGGSVNSTAPLVHPQRDQKYTHHPGDLNRGAGPRQPAASVESESAYFVPQKKCGRRNRPVQYEATTDFTSSQS